MQQFKFHRGATGLFGSQHIQMCYDQYSILPFINRSFSKENIDRTCDERKRVDRELLVSALREQYRGMELGSMVSSNLESLLHDNTFTITTGHQLSIFTGPLFFVIKILHVIKMTEELNASATNRKFVPVYWMASEDHDFDEIAELDLFGKKLKWNSSQGGAVGQYQLDEGFQEVMKEFQSFFREDQLEIQELLESYSGRNLAEATRNLVHHLFGKYGLIIIDGDDAALKRSFIPIVKKELSSSFAYQAVSSTNEKLVHEGLKVQVNPREINLFYLEKGKRLGITKEVDNYLLGNERSLSEVEIITELNDYPERFSPNVVLRPLYQEHILPNVVYVGGGGEISYWLQLKDVFEAADIQYPLIQVRNSVIWIESAVEKKIAKIELPLELIYKSADELKQWFLDQNATELLDDDSLINSLKTFGQELENYVLKADPALQQYARAEITKIEKQVEGIRSKVTKVAKGKHDDGMKAIEFIKSRLFPGNQLQERMINFFQFCAAGNVSDRLDSLKNSLEPFNSDLIIIREA